MSENKTIRGSLSPIILETLVSGDKYGYEILEEIKNRSNGTVILKQPSLYSCLRRMENQDYISSYWQDSAVGGKRHYYKITDKGLQFYNKNKGSIDYSALSEENVPATPTHTQTNTYTHEHTTQEDDGLKVIKQESLFQLAKAIEDNENSENNRPFKKDNFEQINLFKSTMAGVIKPDQNRFDKVDEEELNNINSNTTHFSSFETIFTNDKPLDNQIDILKEIDSLPKQESSDAVDLDFSSLVAENNPKIDNRLINNNIYLKSNMEDYDDYSAEEYNPIKFDNGNNPKTNGDYILRKSPDKPNEYYMDVIDKLYSPVKQNVVQSTVSDIDDDYYESFDTDSDAIQELNTELKSNGIRLRQYNKVNEKFNPHGNYIRYNKLRLIEGWALYGISLIETWLVFMIIALTNNLVASHLSIYISASAICLIYPIVLTLFYVLQPNYQIKTQFRLGLALFNKALAMLTTMLLVMAVCLLLGMNSITNPDFYSLWILPLILSTNYLVSSILYKLLIKTKRFSY